MEVFENLRCGAARLTDSRLLGLNVSDFDVQSLADILLSSASYPPARASMVVTPNIQHVALMRHDPELRSAMQGAEVTVLDGFPVVAFARLRGHRPAGRVTGRQVVEELMRNRTLSADHRLFFLVDSERTADAVNAWAALLPEGPAVRAEVAPARFGSSAAYCADLAGRISGFRATLLFMALSAPQNELFIHRYRAQLPNCWGLCIGQSVKVALRLVTPPPPWVVTLNCEWLWRALHEPRRLLPRYASAATGFLAAVLKDLFGWRDHRK